MYEEIYISTNLYQKCLQQESTRCDPQYKISMGTKFNRITLSLLPVELLVCPSSNGFCSKFTDIASYTQQHDTY